MDPLDGATTFADTCREVVALLTDYLDGALSPPLAAAVQAHIADCDGCAIYLDQIRATISAVGRLRVEALPAGMQRSVTEAFQRILRDRAGNDRTR